MRLEGLGFLALGALPSVGAFRDTSPFFFFSSHKFETSSQQIQSGSSVLEDVTNKLRSCPSDFYVVVSQPGVHAADYNTKRSAPRLREQVLKKDNSVESSFTVSEVVGDVDVRSLQSMLESNCGAGVMDVDVASNQLPSPSSYNSRPQILNVDFSRLPADSGREQMLSSHDLYLAGLVDLLPTPNYTVIYSTTPRGDGELSDSAGQPSHEANPHSHHGALHIQQRRNAHHHLPHAVRDGEEKDDPDNRALFEKYQFLSPGIFMGLMVGLLLLTILYFGFYALGSLQVSYASFAKESGPGTAKKQQ